MLRRHPAEGEHQARSRNRRCLGDSQQSPQTLRIPILDCSYTGGECLAYTHVLEGRFAESPAVLAGNRESVEMRHHTVVMATKMLEFDMGCGGEGRTCVTQRRRFFGVLLDNRSDRRARRIQVSAGELAGLFLEFS